MPDALALASEQRQDRVLGAEIDKTIDLLLANYERVTANPRSMGYLRFLLKHYAKSAHPWKDCYHDNFKRFGPKTAALCGVLKDTIRQGTHWRGKGPRPSDHGAPGVAIAEADAPFAPPFGGHHGHSAYKLSEGCLDKAFAAEFGVDEVPGEVFDLLFEIASRCDVTRVLLGLDEPPVFSLEESA